MASEAMTVGQLSAFLMYAFWVGISIAGEDVSSEQLNIHYRSKVWGQYMFFWCLCVCGGGGGGVFYSARMHKIDQIIVNIILLQKNIFL